MNRPTQEERDAVWKNSLEPQLKEQQKRMLHNLERKTERTNWESCAELVDKCPVERCPNCGRGKGMFKAVIGTGEIWCSGCGERIFLPNKNTKGEGS